MRSDASTAPLIGVDWLRLILLPSIAMMHVWNILHGTPDINLSANQSLYLTYHKWLSGPFGFAGIYIFFLSFFLYGRSGKTNLLRGKKALVRLAFLVGAAVSTQVIPGQTGSEENRFIWDLFSFAILSFVLVSALGWLSLRTWLWLGACAVALLCVPPLWFQIMLGERLPPLISQILIASRSEMGPNGWFLLPWIGLPILGFAFGRLASSELTPKLSMVITVSFIIEAVIAWAARGVYVIPLKMSADYYDFSFRQHPLVFWRAFFPFCLLIYVLSRPEVNEVLHETFLRFARHLQWSRNFWFAYVIHFGLIDIFSEQKDFLLDHPLYHDFLWLGVIVAAELLLQAFFAALKFYAWLGRRLLGKV